jgi:hypothetical protein
MVVYCTPCAATFGRQAPTAFPKSYKRSWHLLVASHALGQSESLRKSCRSEERLLASLSNVDLGFAYNPTEQKALKSGEA